MYGHARWFKRFSDQFDEQASAEYRRHQFELAGVEPRAREDFIDETRLAILMRSRRPLQYVRLAGRLNAANKFNAKGLRWNHESVRAFIQAFLPTLAG